MLKYEGQNYSLGSWDWLGQKVQDVLVCWGEGITKVLGCALDAQRPWGAFQTQVMPLLWAFSPFQSLH